MKPSTGIVNIRGKEYTTVAKRVQDFRLARPDWSLTTTILHRDLECVVVQAVIADDTGRIRANGHAEEFRKSSDINRTSAVENCETSAIGRALAALGYGGTEFASANEVEHAIKGKLAAPEPEPAISADRQAELNDLAADMVLLHEEGRDMPAIAKWYAAETWASDAEVANEERLYVWGLLKPHSKLRSAIKANAPTKEAA